MNSHHALSTAEAGLAEVSSRRHGLFTRSDWEAHGMGRGRLRTRLEQGLIRRVEPGVYAFASNPETWEQRAAAAALSCPQPGGASHLTAAYLWELVRLWRSPDPIEVVTPRWHRAKRPGLRVHESTDLVSADIVELSGVPVTTVPRTLVDLGASVRSLVEPAVDEALRRHLCTVEDILSMLQRVARKGRRGVGPLRPVLEQRLRWDTITDSYLETLFFKGCEERGIPRPEPQVKILRPDGSIICIADFAWPWAKLAVALDGMETHTERRRFQLDRSQQNEMELLGWMLLRYTWWDITGSMGRAANQIRTALEQRAV